MKKIAEKICKSKNLILILSAVLFVLSFIGMKLTNINYDIFDMHCKLILHAISKLKNFSI